MQRLEDAFTGCLVAVAVGDALGGPVEEIQKDPCRTVARPITEMVGGGYHKLLPGQITDDTEMTLCLARSLVERKGFDPADIAQRFVAWYDDNQIGAGTTTRAAIRQLKAGQPWDQAGYNEKGLRLTGNGSVMRCAPAGLFAYNDLELLTAVSRDQSRITHPHEDCIDSCIFINTMLAQMLNGWSKTNAYLHGLNAISTNKSLAAQYGAIPLLTIMKTSGHVRDTVESAVYAFLTTNTLEEAILCSVNMGGDADTRGAVTGALAGAYYGEHAIPARWKSVLVDRHDMPVYGELCKLGTSLYELTQHRSTSPK
ncbi:ADP-ribosylglycohydrolase family protein [Candidatus Woesearchaeota archaeon]|nr:ADP-ribosylglycohydrolase family protein [Candidatus Woesearchaeota archaeon]